MPSLSKFQKSFAPRTITGWNSLSDPVTSLASVPSFRTDTCLLCRSRDIRQEFGNYHRNPDPVLCDCVQDQGHNEANVVVLESKVKPEAAYMVRL